MEFQQKKRERERKIIQIEKEELDRREDEVNRKLTVPQILEKIFRFEDDVQNMML